MTFTYLTSPLHASLVYPKHMHMLSTIIFTNVVVLRSMQY